MRRLCALLALVLLGGACGDGSDEAETGNSTTIETTSTTAAASTTTTEAASTTVGDPGELPGEVIELYPYEGASLAVVGVERGDTLAVRSGPGTDFDVVHELSPLETEVIATGHNRQIDDSIWAEVDTNGDRGWANVAYLLHLGTTDDITDQLSDPSGELPAGETMVDVAEAVAAVRTSTEHPSRVAIIEDPEVGELGSITVDVIGMGDDSLGGERLHILAEPVPEGEAFVVQSVQRLSLCSRGVTDDGLCV